MSFSKRSLYLLSSAVSLGVLASAAPAYAQSAPADEMAEPGDAGNIVVTARKRKENILKTPVTVTAVTSEQIEARGIVTMDDLAGSTPGININNNSNGHADRSFQQVSLRGFTPISPLASTTSMFIDGVPVSSASMFTTISSPERIEILKGPQSAYFGRNTFAGAINVVNKEPTGEWTGSVAGMVGTRDNWRFRGEVEGSIVGDQLTFRTSYERFHKGGSWTNAYDGSKLGEQESQSVTLFVVAKPTERLTIKAFGYLGKDEDGPAAQTRLLARNAVTSTAPNASVFAVSQANCRVNGNPFICGVAPDLINPVSANTIVSSGMSKWLRNLTTNVLSKDETIDHYGLLRYARHAHATVDYEISDALTASALAGYNYETWSTLIDLDGFDTSGIINSTYPDGYYDFSYLINKKSSDKSVEGRLSYDQGPLRGVLGVSYVDASTKQSLGSYSAGVAFMGGDSKNKTLGVFFGATYDFTPELSVSVEGRYQKDTLESYAGQFGQLVASSVWGITPRYYQPGELFIKSSFKNFTPRLIVNYQVNPDTMIYASYARGVNPGEFNSNLFSYNAAKSQFASNLGMKPTVEPEKLTNYELGIKGRALGNSLIYTAAGYYAQWRNQINQLTSVYPVDGDGIYASVNTGAADLYGLEASVLWKVNDLISIDAAASTNISDIKKYRNLLITNYSGISDFSGKSMPNTSKYSANIGVNFGGGIRGVDEGSWFWRTDWNFKSGVYADQANIVRTPDLHLFNTRVGVTKGKASLELFVNNIFNNKTYTSIGTNYVIDAKYNGYSDVYNALFVGLPELRTAGVQLKVGF